MAKNVIAVANSENLRTELGGTNANDIDDLRLSSSRGPAADGRVKPDITAPGTYIAGSRAGTLGSVWGAIDVSHAYSGGTSHSAPQIAGAAALFTQYWKNANGGQNPSPSLLKAALLISGQEMDGFETGTSIPNGDEGWGRANLKLVMNTGVPMYYQNESTQMQDVGSTVVFNGSVGDGSKPVRVALVWTDPPGAGDPALVNDLDLKVTVGGNVFIGNNFINGSSAPLGPPTPDSVNNIEMVWLPAGMGAGQPVKIEVTSSALNGDGIPGNGDSTDQTFSIVGYNVSDQVAASSKPADFDGDGKTDLSIFRPGPGQWWYLRSSDQSVGAFTFGVSTDIPTPYDFSGDGKADAAFFRPGTGEWYVLRSEDFTFYAFPFGTNGDVPAPGDYDGDNTADVGVYRPSTGQWFILRSSDSGVTAVPFGVAEDRPVVDDFDGDGLDDIAVFRPSVQEWWLLNSTVGVIAYQFGSPGDIPVQGDYTGDGKADVAFFRHSTGEWYVIRSEDNSFYAFPWGTNGDIPVPGDYDGDGRTDAGVWRESQNGTWFINGSNDGFISAPFGQGGDVPLPGFRP